MAESGVSMNPLSSVEEPKKEVENVVVKEKPVASYLATETARTDKVASGAKNAREVRMGKATRPPTHFSVVLGAKCHIAYNLWFVFWASLAFGYLNAGVFKKYNIYLTLQTGNLVLLCRDCAAIIAGGSTEDETTAIVRFVVMLTLCIGSYINCTVSRYLVSRERVLMSIWVQFLFAYVISTFWGVLDANGFVEKSGLVVIFYAIPGGALLHWTSKLGYPFHVIVGHLNKITESIYKYLNGYSLGGPKQRGDLMISQTIILGNVLGAICAFIIFRFYIVIPVGFAHCASAGCFDKYSWYPKSLHFAQWQHDDQWESGHWDHHKGTFHENVFLHKKHGEKPVHVDEDDHHY